MENKKAVLKGLRDGVPVGLGYLAVSFTLGIAAKKVGITAFQAVIMSLTNNTSAGEFAALTLIGTGSSYLEMAFTQLVINIRYLLMSCSLSQKLEEKTSVVHRLLLGYCITDEVFGISYSFEGRLNPFYTYSAMAVAAAGWSAGTGLGVVLGSILPDRVLSALGVALYGMFIAVIVPPAKKDRVLAGLIVITMAISWGFTKIPFLSGISSGFRIVILTVVISAAAAALFPVKGSEESE